MRFCNNLFSDKLDSRTIGKLNNVKVFRSKKIKHDSQNICLREINLSVKRKCFENSPYNLVNGFFKVTVCYQIFSKAQRFLHSCINKQNWSNHSFYIMTFSCQWTYIPSRFNVLSYLQLSCSIHKTGRFLTFLHFSSVNGG